MRREQGEQWISSIKPHGRRFRFRLGCGTETTSYYSYDTIEEAEQEHKKAVANLKRIKAERTGLTLEDALGKYEVFKQEEGSRGTRRRKALPNAPFSAKRDRRRASDFFGGDLTRPVPRLGTEAAKALYVALRARPTRHSTEDKPRVRSDSEHQACLAAARRFGDWLVKERIWTSNPIAEVAPVGRPKAGEESKVQLRRDEAVLWLAEAKRQAQEGQVDALAAAACFVGALRVSEVLERQVRDLEDQARCLFVPKSKSRAGRRRVPMRPLAELLRAQVVRAAAAPRSEGVVVQLSPPLFPELDCYAVRRAVHRICRAAGVPIITTHALRGTMISLAAAGGEALGAIADDVGHASEAVTRRSYATADAQTEGALARGMARLAGEGA